MALRFENTWRDWSILTVLRLTLLLGQFVCEGLNTPGFIKKSNIVICEETFTVATRLSVYEVNYSRCGSNVLLFNETRGDANKIYSFIQLYTLCLSVITYSRKGGLLEVLLTFPLGVHGIQNRLSLRLIPFSQLVDLPLHFRVQTSHSLLQFFVGEKLQLQDTASLYIQVIFLYNA